MSRSVRFKLSGERLDMALKFANDLGMDLNQAAERALNWTIRKAYEESILTERMNASTQANAPGDSETEAASAPSGAPLA